MKSKIGQDGFIWWIGSVTNVNDPLKLGRCQVKIFDWYDNDDTDPADYPWAQPLQPITSAAHNQIGLSPTGLVVDSWVVGFFLDGIEGQRPVIMGSVAAVTEQEDLNNQVEPDVHRLARNDTADEQNYTPKLIATKNNARTLNVPIAYTGTWSEPAYAYNAKYPDNHVRSTKSGHIKEYDDTSGSERIHEYHKSGTFYEIDKEGTKVTRIVKDNYVIIAGDDFINVKGDVNLTVDGDVNTYIKGDWNIKVDGKKKETVVGSVTEIYLSQSTTVATIIDVNAGVQVDIDAPRIDLN